MALKGRIPWNKKYDVCTIEGCGKKHDSHGLCHAHAEKYRRGLDPQKYKDRKNKFYQDHIETERQKARNARQYLRLVAIAVYSNETYKCACCPEDEYLFLSIDHINNDGHIHRKKIGSGRLYQWLWNEGYPEGFQVLCYNCNFVKGWYGSCLVHKKEGDTL